MDLLVEQALIPNGTGVLCVLEFGTKLIRDALNVIKCSGQVLKKIEDTDGYNTFRSVIYRPTKSLYHTSYVLRSIIMRMWMINPKLLCRKHLLGEHGELHKFIPSFRKQYSVTNRVSPVVQIELSSYQQRHDEIADEMLRRGMNHKSPLPELPDFSYLPDEHFNAKVDTEVSIRDLKERCKECDV